MIYQLPNGKCIEITVEQFLKLTDTELQNLISYDVGEDHNDPFFNSVLKNGFVGDDYEELEEELIKDLLDTPLEDKFDDDFINYDDLEQ
jgi:hypothetical protein